MAVTEGTGSNNPTGGSLGNLLSALKSRLGRRFDSTGTDREQAIKNIARLHVLDINPGPEVEDAIRPRGEIDNWYRFVTEGQTVGAIEFGGENVGATRLLESIASDVTREQLAGPGDRDPRPEPDGDGLPSPGAGDRDPRPADGRGGSTGKDVTGATDDDAAPADDGGETPDDSDLPDEPRIIPGGEEVWKVGPRVFLAYKIPGSNTPIVYRVENNERLRTIYGGEVPEFDRELTKAQFRKMSPWKAGLSAEIENTDDHPWQQFMSDFNRQAELRPWIKDPTFQAMYAEAYLEEREPTDDDLARTDWWQNHTADERAWMEESSTLGRKEVQRRKQDAARTVSDALREAGMDNAPQHIVDFLATQRITGKWSQTKTQQQIRKLTDPYAPGQLDRGLKAALADPQFGESGDARAISQGRGAVRERVREIFENRNVPLTVRGEKGEADPEARVNRIARQILKGQRSFSDVRESVDWLASNRADAGRPGGLDVTREGEDNVRSLATRWLGPDVGSLPDDQVAEWAGRIRNNPDAEQEFIDHLRQQRLALLPGYQNENLTYEDIVSPVRNLATNVWGQPVRDETMLVDLANTHDYTEMAKRLRSEGLKQGVTKVKQEMLSGLAGTALGNQITRSPI